MNSPQLTPTVSVPTISVAARSTRSVRTSHRASSSELSISSVRKTERQSSETEKVTVNADTVAKLAQRM